MYDELVRQLRDFAVELRKAEDALLVRDAADAIENLATNYDAATDIMKHQTEYIEELEANKPRWIPVTERLPEEKDRYLTVAIEPWFGTTVVDTMRWSGVWMYDGRQTEATVTHWMPLPEPPKEESNGV